LPYLNVISDLINTGQLDPDVLAEVIFEPKKMYLDSVDPQTFMGPLKAFTETHQVSVRVALPTVIRAWDEPVLKKWCLELALEGFAKFEVGNPGALGLLEQWGIPTQDVTGDFMLYGLNRKAVSFWQRQGLSKLCLSIEGHQLTVKPLA